MVNLRSRGESTSVAQKLEFETTGVVQLEESSFAGLESMKRDLHRVTNTNCR